MFGRILILMRKELAAVLRDPRSRTVVIVPPLVQLFVFSFAATLDVKHAELAVFNRDEGKWGTELVRRFAGSPTFDVVGAVRSSDAVAKTIDEQRALGVLVVPSDFSRGIEAGKGGDVQLLLDGRKTHSAQIVQGYASVVVQRFNRDLRPGAPERAETVERDWFNPNLVYLWYTVPGLLGILTMLITLLVTALSVAREREMGTFEQILVSPLRAGEILAGKALAALTISLTEGAAFVAIAVFAFRIPLTGSLALLAPALIVFLVSVIGVGLFVSSLSMTQQQAILGAFLLFSPAVLLSGFATPIENMPHWLQAATAVNPLRWFLIISRGVFLKDLPAEAVWAAVWPLAAIAAVTLTAAAWLFRHRME